SRRGRHRTGDARPGIHHGYFSWLLIAWTFRCAGGDGWDFPPRIYPRGRQWPADPFDSPFLNGRPFPRWSECRLARIDGGGQLPTGALGDYRLSDGGSGDCWRGTASSLPNQFSV